MFSKFAKNVNTKDDKPAKKDDKSGRRSIDRKPVKIESPKKQEKSMKGPMIKTSYTQVAAPILNTLNIQPNTMIKTSYDTPSSSKRKRLCSNEEIFTKWQEAVQRKAMKEKEKAEMELQNKINAEEKAEKEIQDKIKDEEKRSESVV